MAASSFAIGGPSVNDLLKALFDDESFSPSIAGALGAQFAQEGIAVHGKVAGQITSDNSAAGAAATSRPDEAVQQRMSCGPSPTHVRRLTATDLALHPPALHVHEIGVRGKTRRFRRTRFVPVEALDDLQQVGLELRFCGAERAIHHIARRSTLGEPNSVAAIAATISVLIICAFSCSIARCVLGWTERAPNGSKHHECALARV